MCACYEQYVRKKKKGRECAEQVVVCEIKDCSKNTINESWRYEAVLGNLEKYVPVT